MSIIYAGLFVETGKAHAIVLFEVFLRSGIWNRYFVERHHAMVST